MIKCPAEINASNKGNLIMSDMHCPITLWSITHYFDFSKRWRLLRDEGVR